MNFLANIILNFLVFLFHILYTKMEFMLVT